GETIEDFWRRRLPDASPLFLQYLRNNKFLPEDLLKRYAADLTLPRLKVVPPAEDINSAVEEAEFLAAAEAVRRAWPGDRAEVARILTQDEGLKRNIYKLASIPVWLEAMDQFVGGGASTPVLFDKFEKFTWHHLETSVKKNCRAPQHRFFHLCDRLWDAAGKLKPFFEQRRLGLTAALFDFVRAELEKKKAEKNVQSFSDLLVKLQRALAGPGGRFLVGALRHKYKAALIDEFQDTDPVQYDIFLRLFGEDRVLFLIGDPKQAIFGFRNADIFTYLEAARDAGRRFTLLENWRAEPGLIKAVNTVFARGRRPFFFQDIPFEPARSAENREPAPLLEAGQVPPPFRLWYIPATWFSDQGKPIPKGQARKKIIQSLAAEIARLVEKGRTGRLLTDGRPLGAGDLAVLVRTNDEARKVAAELARQGVPHVLYSTASLFESGEAVETLRLLAALAEPEDEGLLKAALATDMLGLSGHDLERLGRDEPAWEEWLVRFNEYRRAWLEHGFIRAYRGLLTREKVLPRLMRFPDGERRCTNVLHLAEVLHQAAFHDRLGPAALVKWLARRMEADTAGLEEYQLRLESDENAVKIVTVHRCKGLEYPVVFCPFTWGGSRPKSGRDIRFHDLTGTPELSLDLGSDEIEEHRLAMTRENLAENLRLLYVALTRARSRCYLVWGRFHQAETSAPAYLLHQPADAAEEDLAQAAEERFHGLDEDGFLGDLEALAAASEGTISLEPLPEEPGPFLVPTEAEAAPLAARTFTGRIDRSWRISSFSSLVSGQAPLAEQADYDAAPPPGAEEEAREAEPRGFFAFPPGAKTGLFLHSLFEELDFTRAGELAPALVKQKLAAFGFAPEWSPDVLQMVDKVINAPLKPGRPDFTLARVPPEERLNELEFYYPIQKLAPEALTQVLGEAPGLPLRFEELDFRPAGGFMKGFMDLVFRFAGRFYLLDWKSNYLGPTAADYGPAGLAQAMRAGHYALQYLIYTVALDRYLALRQPGYSYDRDFGGVFYLFLRGVDPAHGPEYGVYRDRPSARLVAELSRRLLDRTGRAGA
ncbi:MAG: exodeoxyribonuclease V subunit beta, partial [Thermodesulfobacteriota bacterium]